MKTKGTDQRKIFAIHISDKVFMSRIHRELLGSNCQKENNLIKTLKI